MIDLVPGTIYTTPGGGKISVSNKGDLAIHTDRGFKALPVDFWLMAYDNFMPGFLKQVASINEQLNERTDIDLRGTKHD